MGFGPAFRLCKFLLIAVIASHPVSAQVLETPDWCTDDVTSTVQLPSRVTCNLCPPGTYVVQDCTADNPDPQCESCTTGRFYNPCYNYATRCLSCSDCTPYFSADGRNGTVEGQECTPTRDRVCRCSSNHFWDLKTSGCRQKTSCEKGFGVAHIATHKADTVCIRCEDGTFSDEKSLTQQCQICTDCGGGTTLRPCTNTRDMLCDFTGPQSTSTSPVSAQSRSVPQVLVPAGSTKMEAVIGGSVGGFLLFLLFLGCLWWRCRRKKQLSAPASIRRRPSQSDSEGIEMNARMLPPWTPEVPSPPATPPWTPEVPSPPATPPRTPEVPSRPATPPPTPNPDSPTFPKKISDDGCCRPLMNTEDPGPPNNAHDIYEKEANPHPLQPISLPPEDFQPSGGRLEPVGSSSDDMSFRNPVQNV